MRHYRSSFLLLGLAAGLLLCCSACKVRSFMVSMIVSGEMDKIANAHPHRTWYRAQLDRNGAPHETSYCISYHPPDRLVCEILSPASATGVAMYVDWNHHVYRDPRSGYFERIRLRGPANLDEFEQSRYAAYRNTLEESEVFIESGTGEYEDSWAVITRPRPSTPWETCSVVHVDGDSKQTVHVAEYTSAGETLNEFWITKRDEVALATREFELQPEPGWHCVDIDLRQLTDNRPAALVKQLHLPRELGDWNLRAVTATERWRAADYSHDGMVLSLIEVPRPGLGPVMPNARAATCYGLDCYLLYFGNFITLTTYVDGHRMLLVSNVGLDPLFALAREALAPRQTAQAHPPATHP